MKSIRKERKTIGKQLVCCDKQFAITFGIGIGIDTEKSVITFRAHLISLTSFIALSLGLIL